MAAEEVMGVVADGDHSKAVRCKEEEEEEAVLVVSPNNQELVTIVENLGTSSRTAVSDNKKSDQEDAYPNQPITRETEAISLINGSNSLSNYMQTLRH